MFEQHFLESVLFLKHFHSLSALQPDETTSNGTMGQTPIFMILKVRATNRIVYTKKDVSLEEIPPDKNDTKREGERVMPPESSESESGFQIFKLFKMFSSGPKETEEEEKQTENPVEASAVLETNEEGHESFKVYAPSAQGQYPAFETESSAVLEKDETGSEVYKLYAPTATGKYEIAEVETADGSASLPVDDEDYESSASGTIESSGKPVKILAQMLDTSGRVGPMFEVHDEMIFVPPPPLPQRDIVHGRFDTALLESERMINLPSKGCSTPHRDTESLKRALKKAWEDIDEEVLRAAVDGDYGSSYILPVLASVNYDNNTVPTAFADIPVLVSVQMHILYLANFDSELMEYSIDVELELSWHDLRLVNNYTKPIRIREKQVLDLIWKPDPYFVNSKFSHFHGVSFPNFRMRVFPDGLVKYTLRVTSVCNCFMLFCLYPHDRQTCDLRISSIAYPASFVRFVWHSDPVELQSKISLPELHIQQIRTEECVVEGKLIHSSCLRLVFDLERDGGRFVVEKYIPSTLAMMFAWVAPYVPYNYEDVRIITPITRKPPNFRKIQSKSGFGKSPFQGPYISSEMKVLLTLVQMEKGDKEIRTSYLTSMDVWFAAMKAFTALSLIESLVVLALIKRSRAVQSSIPRAPNQLVKANLQAEGDRLTRLYHRLDSLCRFLSPFVFVMFFICYVLFIAQGDDRGCVVK
ncbi:unnamed protein product [Nippostrongylus brasiliensis]|uniref:Neur_chan_LBD domain-containing protein n=1 Tax=Nippostrongylus brasiliensis TaxID=27835 RepID=A0A0N4YBN6_NIPBR|nr:unnamed protein product [Nippostrongylus brasiliensis]